ncbi:hypothetical protein ENBRE01_2815, partial [Enteropsectra breve]
CSRCQSRAVLQQNQPLFQRCTWKECKYRESVLNDTPFYHSRLARAEVLKVIWLWSEGVKKKTIAKIVEVSRQAVSLVIKKLKNKLISNFWLHTEQIGGAGIVVEIDESKFGLRKYHKGHHVEGVWVFGLVEKTPERRIVLIPVEKRNRETLETLLKKYVDKDSIVHSDCWKAYAHIKSYFAEHKQVNHSKGFKDPITGITTNTIEGNWSSIKADTPKTA